MTPQDKSAIMWFVWSIAVCILAILIAVYVGAFYTSSESIKGLEPHDGWYNETAIIKIYDGVTITRESYDDIKCAYQLGMCCK